MEDENNQSIGHYEDLIADHDLQLQELLAHVKLLANSTGVARDFEITPEDINAIANTIHDKTISVLLTEQRLKISLNKLDV